MPCKSNRTESEMDNKPIEPLCDEYQYSAITGQSVHTARRNRLLGKGCPYVKLGSRVFYRPSDVRTYIARNVRDTKQEPP